MLIHRCDNHGCRADAGFRVTYDRDQKPVETCMDHVGWPIVVASQSKGYCKATIEIIDWNDNDV